MGTKSILIIDDDEVMLEGLKIALEEEGLSIITSNDNSDIFKLISKHDPQLILLDYRMPGKDGAQLTRQVKTDGGTMQIPIIMLSASKGAKNIASQSGADAFLEKPFELDELVRIVQKFLS